MAKQVENRVVEMEFKNKDFEKAVAVTLDSIDKLNKKLDSLNDVNTKGFEGITQAANKVDFSGLISGIENIENRFTTITGRIKTQLQDWVIEEIIKKPLQELERVADTVFSTIVDKGKSRAQNLAQAKFQLEALGLTWEQIYDDMSYAVDGTAYGLDEAAMAASQFSAANVKLGKDMRAALRGISGVAAMTGRSYGEIAQIFTTVAGKGKAMNGELARIEERGLGAKKAIADYINDTNAFGNGIKVTTDQIFDLASKSQISFEIFSKAMDTAFGEHATAANNLFTGALANTKAALGRIGERFATPIYEDIRQVLVHLIPVINDFKKSLDPIVNSVTKVTGGIRDLGIQVLDFIHSSFDPKTDKSIFEGTINSRDELIRFLNQVARLIDGIGNSINGGALSVFGEILRNAFENLINILSSVKGGIEDVFDPPTMGTVMNFIENIKKFTQYLKLNEKELDDVHRIIRGIASALDIVNKYASAVFEVFGKPLFQALGFAGDSLLDLLAWMGDLIYEFDQGLGSKVEIIVELSNWFTELKMKISDVTAELKDIFNAHFDTTKFGKLSDVATTFGDTIIFVFDCVAGAIIFAYDNLMKFISVLTGNTEFNAYLKSLADQNRVLTWISGTWEKIKTTLNDIISGNKKLTEALGLDKLAEKFKFLQPIIDTFKEHYKTIFEAKEVDIKSLPFIDQFIIGLKKAITELDFDDLFGMIGAGFYAYWAKKSIEIKSAIAKTFGNFVDTFQKLADGISVSLVKMTKETNAEKILKIAAAIALLAGSILLLGKMDAGELFQGISAIIGICVTLGILVKVLAKTLETTKKVDKETEELMDPGATRNTTTKSKGGKKGSAITRVTEKLTATLTETKETITETIKDISSVPALILSLGASIFLIGSAIAKIAKVSDGSGNVERVMAMLTITMAIMLFAVYKLAQLSSENEIDSDAINSIAKIFLMLGIAIRLIAGGIAALAIIEAFAPGSIWGPTLALILIITALTAAIFALTKFANLKENAAELTAAGAAMVMMGAAIALLTIPLVALSALSAAGAPLLPAVAIVGILMLEMAALIALFAIVSGRIINAAPGMLAGAAAMLIMAFAMNVMLAPIAAITALVAACKGTALSDAVNTIMILMAVMAAIALAFGVAGGIGNVAVIGGMIAGAAAMLIIAKALTALLVPLAGIMAMQKAGGFWEAFGGLAAGLGLLAAAALIAIPLAPGLQILMAVIGTFGAVVLAIAKSFFYAGNGVLALVTALSILQNINFDNMAIKIAQAAAAMIHGFRMAIVAGIPEIQQGFVALIAAGMGALTSSVGMISEACIVLLLDVITAIDNHAQEIGFHLGHALLDIVLYAIAGLVGSLSDFVAKLFGQEGNKISEWLMDRLLPDKSDSKTAGEKVFGWLTGSESKKAAGEAGEEIGEEAGANIYKGINSDKNRDGVISGFEGLLGSAAGEIDFSAIQDKMGEGGQISTESLIAGMQSPMDIKGGKAVAAENLADLFGTSYTDKLDEYVPKAHTKGFAITNAAVEGAAEGQNSNSPSKEAIKLGNYFVQGYVEGLDSDAPEKMMEEKAKTLIALFSTAQNEFKPNTFDPLSDTISNLATIASTDMDFQPTITPVLDLSNVNQGFASLDNLFSAQRSLQLASDAAAFNEAGRSLNLQIQNDNRNGMHNSINALGNKIDRLGDTLANRQVVLDSGELVGGITPKMDRSLGIRAIRVQRGGARA